MIDPHTTAPTESLSGADRPEVPSMSRSRLPWILAVIAVAVVLLVSFFAYRYFTPKAGQIDSVAVLPFENGSGDPNLDYLSDGLSESLIDKLLQLPQLKVIARNSSFRYRDAGVDLQKVASELGGARS